jgi:TolA-binding protein
VRQCEGRARRHALGGLGHAYAEMGNLEEAVDYYLKAARKTPNKFTTPQYLMYAGIVFEMLNKPEEAEKVYQKIKNDYADTNEGREIEKYLARARAAKG